jgi:hypothetical protein
MYTDSNKTEPIGNSRKLAIHDAWRFAIHAILRYARDSLCTSREPRSGSGTFVFFSRFDRLAVMFIPDPVPMQKFGPWRLTRSRLVTCRVNVGQAVGFL